MATAPITLVLADDHPIWRDGVRADLADGFEVVGEAGVVVPDRLMGGEDMAYFLEAVPGCFAFIGSANAERGLVHPHHSPRFDFDEAAARRRDDDRRLLHRCKLSGADDALGLGRHRQMDADEICRRDSVLQRRHRLYPRRVHGSVAHVGIVGEHSHAEGLRTLTHLTADPAEAQDPEGLAVDVQAPQEVPLPGLPLAGAGVMVGLHDPAGGRHQQRPREIRGRLGEDVGRVGDHDPAPTGGGHVDVVVADRDVGDDLEARRGEDLVVDRVRDLANEALLALEPGEQVLSAECVLVAIEVHGHVGGDQCQRFCR